MNDATFEITIFGDSPEEMKNARIIDEFKTPTSESYLVDVGAFDDGMRMYVMAERFESTGWKWSNSFPEMDALQLADYLEGCAKIPNDNDWEDYNDYCIGVIRISEKLKEMGKAESIQIIENMKTL